MKNVNELVCEDLQEQIIFLCKRVEVLEKSVRELDYRVLGSTKVKVGGLK